MAWIWCDKVEAALVGATARCARDANQCADTTMIYGIIDCHGASCPKDGRVVGVGCADDERGEKRSTVNVQWARSASASLRDGSASTSSLTATLGARVGRRRVRRRARRLSFCQWWSRPAWWGLVIDGELLDANPVRGHRTLMCANGTCVLRCVRMLSRGIGWASKRSRDKPGRGRRRHSSSNGPRRRAVGSLASVLDFSHCYIAIGGARFRRRVL